MQVNVTIKMQFEAKNLREFLVWKEIIEGIPERFKDETKDEYHGIDYVCGHSQVQLCHERDVCPKCGKDELTPDYCDWADTYLWAEHYKCDCGATFDVRYIVDEQPDAIELTGETSETYI